MPCLAELHSHTSVSDGRPTPEEVVIAAARLGLSAIAVSDHNTFRGSAIAVKAARDMELGVHVIPANEVRTSRGDVLVLCPSLPGDEPVAGLDPAELRDWSEERACIMVAAHPFHPGRHGVGLYLLRHYGLFDGVEAWNARGLPIFNMVAERFALSRGMPATSGSDAHVLSELGRAPTLIKAEDCRPEYVVEAVRRGLCAPTRAMISPRAAVEAVLWSLERRLRPLLARRSGPTL